MKVRLAIADPGSIPGTSTKAHKSGVDPSQSSQYRIKDRKRLSENRGRLVGFSGGERFRRGGELIWSFPVADYRAEAVQLGALWLKQNPSGFIGGTGEGTPVVQFTIAVEQRKTTIAKPVFGDLALAA